MPLKAAKEEVQDAIKAAKTEIDKDIEKAAGRARRRGDVVASQQPARRTQATCCGDLHLTKAGLREFRDEVMTGVRDLKGSVATLHERMGRFGEPNARRNKLPPDR
jgi:hypothetical protein